MENNFHKSVLIDEVVANIGLKDNGIYVDMTLGRGGHTELLLSKLGPNSIVIGIDQDETAIKYCQNKFQNDKRVTIIKNNFCNIKAVLHDLKIKYVDGILMDLGVSSPQLDNSYRGFSYHNDGPLDMRMDMSQNLTAHEIINTYSFKDLCYIFKKNGEIKRPVSVVNAIIKYRQISPITTTLQLVEIIKQAIPKNELMKKKHFARCYFQALRIAVNDELNILEKTIGIAANCLKQDGRLEIITFHSLEDKVVIKKFQELSASNLPKEIPIFFDEFRKFKIINTKPILPNEQEIASNNRARSAQLRILQRIGKIE